MDILSKSTYNYNLPEELIAQYPVEPRDMSRLLVYHKNNKSIEHKIFRDIIDYLVPGDVLVVNNTKVIPARLYGVKSETGAKIEVFLLKRFNNTCWNVLIKPLKRVKVGTEIVFNEKLKCVVTKIKEFGEAEIEFKFNGIFEEILNEVGTMPLPHYIKKECKDKTRYNTVYSKVDGSSAAPTAGLHFTTELLEKLKAKGVIVTEVLLHVGLGTFRPVSEDNILNHKMHTEHYEISSESAEIINKAKREGRRVIAVGTTSIRTLESAATKFGKICECSDDTSIFIYPGYNFKVVDGVITNFHLPESTLIMLVSAFIGINETLNMYNIAVKEKYRFFSFGDATLLI